MLLIIGLSAGVIIGYYLSKIVHVFNEGIKLDVFGYEISIDKTASGTNMEEREPTNITPEINECDLCDGEDMFVKGTKNLIPCPECNRNRNKFNTLPV